MLPGLGKSVLDKLKLSHSRSYGLGQRVQINLVDSKQPFKWFEPENDVIVSIQTCFKTDQYRMQMGYASVSQLLEQLEFFCPTSTSGATTGFAFATCGFPEAEKGPRNTDISRSAPRG